MTMGAPGRGRSVQNLVLTHLGNSINQASASVIGEIARVYGGNLFFGRI
jgi:hypothetical protein